MLLFWIIYNIQHLVDDVRLIVIINCYDLIKTINMCTYMLYILMYIMYISLQAQLIAFLFISHVHIWINGEYVLYNFVFCNHFLVDIFHFSGIHPRWRWSVDCLFINAVYVVYDAITHSRHIYDFYFIIILWLVMVLSMKFLLLLWHICIVLYFIIMLMLDDITCLINGFSIFYQFTLLSSFQRSIYIFSFHFLFLFLFYFSKL